MSDTVLFIDEKSNEFKKALAESQQTADIWIKAATHGVVTLNDVQSVLLNTPPFSLASDIMFSAYDVIEDTKALINDHTKVENWIYLVIDIIPLIPFPATKVVGPPMKYGMHMVRSAIRKSGGKLAFKDALIQQLQMVLHERVAGQFFDATEYLLNNIDKIKSDIQTKIKESIDAFIKTVDDQFKKNKLDPNRFYTDAVSQLNKASQYDAVFPTKAEHFKNFADYLVLNLRGVTSAKTGQQIQSANMVVSAAENIWNSVKSVLRTIQNAAKTFVDKAFGSVGDSDASSSGVYYFLFTLNALALGALKKSKVGQKVLKSIELRFAAIRKRFQKKTKGKEDPCNCKKSTQKAASKRSVQYSTGEEIIIHRDFTLPYAQMLGNRTYISGSTSSNKVLGVKWQSYFNKELLEKKGKVYYLDAVGNQIELPRLIKGKKYFIPENDIEVALLEKDTVQIAFKDGSKEIYKKLKHTYKIDYILYQKVNTLGFIYDQNESLTDVVIKSDGAQLGQLGFEYNEKKIHKIWLIENNSISRLLASYRYDENDDLIQATTENQYSYNYQYKNHLVTRYTDLTGVAMNFEWAMIDDSDKVIHEWMDDGSNEFFFAWDDSIRTTYVKDGLGNTTEYYYNSNGYTDKVIYPDGSSEIWIRDKADRIIQHMYPDGSSEKFKYDQHSNLVEYCDQESNWTYYQYDENSNLIFVRDSFGYLWVNEYDQNNNLIKTINPLKHATSYQYNATGLPVSIKDTKGGTKSLQYDESGNLVEYIDCSGKTTKWSYDEFGRLSVVENALNQKIEYYYTSFTRELREPVLKGLPLNAAGELEKIKYADGTEVHFIHDAEGRLLVHIDANKQITEYTYTASGLIHTRTNALNHKLQYQWDKLSRLKRLINENGAVYEFFYDVVGRLTKEIDFDGNEIKYEYNQDSGRLATSIEVASAHGQKLQDQLSPQDRVQHFIFNSLGQLEQRTVGYGFGHELNHLQTEEFAYDASGKLIDAKNSEMHNQWFYDAVGNLSREHQSDLKLKTTAVWKHSYNEINDRIKTIRPDGQNIDWLTYGTGHVLGLILNGQDVLSFERDDLHRETMRHYANGISQKQKYDDLGRLMQQSIVNGHKSGYDSPTKQNNAIHETQQLIQRLYQYDKSGELIQIQDSRRGNLNYKYDPVGRLLEANSRLGKETFNFDPASNIIEPKNTQKSLQTHNQNIDNTNYGYNRLVNNVVKEYLDQQYQYDAYGQLIRQKSSKGDLYLEWDVFGRLQRTRNHEYSADYRYDALGRRIQKCSKQHHTGDEHNIIYGWDGDTLAYESTKQATKHYIYEKDSFVPMLQAVYSSPIELQETPDWSDKPYSVQRDPLWKTTKQSKGFDDVWFYHCDHLGTPQEMTDHSGAIIWKAQYKAWGECKVEKVKSNFFENSEIISNNIRFQGQYFDEETGLHYNRYRYYSPYVGRFVSKDPIGILGNYNTYVYTNNPLLKIDPLGLKDKIVYRSLSVEDRLRYDAGLDLAPKGLGGCILSHVQGKNTKYLSASETKAGTNRFNSGNGVVAINVSKATRLGSNFVDHNNVLQATKCDKKAHSDAKRVNEVLFINGIPREAMELIGER